MKSKDQIYGTFANSRVLIVCREKQTVTREVFLKQWYARLFLNRHAKLKRSRRIVLNSSVSNSMSS